MPDLKPEVIDVSLSTDYPFMYENFVISTQHDTYLFLEKHEDVIDVLHFNSANIKYGSPNDEARGGHPLFKYGMGIYGLFEVKNSPWIREQMIANRVHTSHTDKMFDDERHFIACFKDVMLEVTCRSYDEKQMSVSEVDSLIHKQLKELKQ